MRVSPLPVSMKSSTASAWAVRGSVKADVRRASVKRALRIVGSLRSICGIRMRPSGGGVKGYRRGRNGSRVERRPTHPQSTRVNGAPAFVTGPPAHPFLSNLDVASECLSSLNSIDRVYLALYFGQNKLRTNSGRKLHGFSRSCQQHRS